MAGLVTVWTGGAGAASWVGLARPEVGLVDAEN
jgi:hypothetical protein